MSQILDVYSFFPELSQDDIVCGLIKGRGSLQGVATSWTRPAVFRLRHDTSLFTIAHELTHLVQGGATSVPHGETACDIWAIERMPVEYLDSPPFYLLDSINIPWNTKRIAIKTLCSEAIQRRGWMRNYIQWLRCRIREL